MQFDIPQSVLDAVDRTAKQLGTTRQEVIIAAVSRYIGASRAENGQGVTAKLDAVYSRHASPVDPVLSAMQARSLPKDEW